MIYVTYIVAGIFIALAFAMLYVFYRSSHFGMFVMGLTYGCSGLLAILLGHWWPLLAGFVLVWMLKWLGLEPGSEARDEGGGMRDEGDTKRDGMTK
jgi:hypothetical protein